MVRVYFSTEFMPLLLSALHRAESTIRVVMFEWTWYPGQLSGTAHDINRSVVAKARKGCDVRVYLHQASIRMSILKRNFKTARLLIDAGCKVKWGGTGKIIHAKVWIIDGKVVFIGSHNISNRAMKGNVEAGVMFDEEGEVMKAVQWFDALWGKPA